MDKLVVTFVVLTCIIFYIQVQICNIHKIQNIDIRLKHLEELIYDNKMEDSRIEIS